MLFDKAKLFFLSCYSLVQFWQLYSLQAAVRIVTSYSCLLNDVLINDMVEIYNIIGTCTRLLPTIHVSSYNA